MPFLLDTSICVHFLRGRSGLDRKFDLSRSEGLFISEISAFELYYGAECSQDAVRSFKSVDDLLSGLTIVPIYGSIKRYAVEKARLRKAGKPMHDEFDLIIGVTAVENDLTLVTSNVKDFMNINGIRIEN